MKNVVVIGAGKIGATVAGLLASTGDYQVTLADRSPEVLDSLDQHERIRTVAADVEDSSKLVDLLNGQFAVLNAAPFHLTTRIAEAARAAHTHYLDLTEDVASMRRVRELAADASIAFIPQCGLAPGFVSIVAFDMAKRFEVLDSVKLRVGALPQYPSNALNYNLTWSTDGVINEYCEPCEAIVNGVRREVPPLEEREEFSLDGITYEVFNTSGGLGTLCDTLEGVAIPHARIPNLKKPFGILARLRKPIDFDAIDSQPIDLVFFLLLPATSNGEQLNALACVARKFRDPETVRRLRRAIDGAELYRAMQ